MKKGRGWFSPKGEWVSSPGARMDIGTQEDGRVGRMCKHGVGHPIGHVCKWEDWMGVHGCDGCCGFFEQNGL